MHLNLKRFLRTLSIAAPITLLSSHSFAMSETPPEGPEPPKPLAVVVNIVAPVVEPVVSVVQDYQPLAANVTAALLPNLYNPLPIKPVEIVANIVSTIAEPILSPLVCSLLLTLEECNYRQEAKRLLLNHPPLQDWVLQDLDVKWQEFISSDQDLDDNLLISMLSEITDRGGNAEKLLTQVNDIQYGDDKELQRLKLYTKIAKKRRKHRLKDLNTQGGQIVFTLTHNYMSTFIGYTEGLSDARNERSFRPDSKLLLLDVSQNNYGKVQELKADKRGAMRDVDVSDDGKRILFSWKKSNRYDDYHIYEYNLSDKSTTQLTFGLGRADVEPQYLPNGDIVFGSTRGELSVPCYWTEVSNLYRMDGEGKFMRRLAMDQVHTLYPTVMENGRVIYTRWDYNDRSQMYTHPLFSMDPDGTAQRIFYGANSWYPNSLLHARSIPGSDKILAVAAGHHTLQRGKLVEIDVSLGRDEGAGVSFIAPERTEPYVRQDQDQQEGDQFKYPYPINDEEFLISFTPDADLTLLPQTPWGTDPNVYGLYWMDKEGKRELLYQHDSIPVGRPVLINKPHQPAPIEDVVDFTQQTGTLYVHNVYEGVGLKDIPYGEAKKLRVVQLNYRVAGVGNVHNYAEELEGGSSITSTPIAVGQGSWDVKQILGDVNIEDDGSALFEIPASVSTYLQILNAKGEVIQTTRSWDTVQPGEKKACRGCHSKENQNAYTYESENTLAWTKQPQKLQPFYGESRGFSFIKEIQPILDAKCVSCHNETSDIISLDGELKKRNALGKRRWSDAYLNLTHSEKVETFELMNLFDAYYDFLNLPQSKDVFTVVPENPFGKYYRGDHKNSMVNWISKMSAPTELPPYSAGAATSDLLPMLDSGEHHGVTISEEEYHKFAAWMDLLVPFVGDYKEANEWSQKDMEYYEYYENKRRLNELEEKANIEALIAQ